MKKTIATTLAVLTLGAGIGVATAGSASADTNQDRVCAQLAQQIDRQGSKGRDAADQALVEAYFRQGCLIVAG